jgi:ribosome-binding protein aMBF1 (putative translation factor)
MLLKTYPAAVTRDARYRMVRKVRGLNVIQNAPFLSGMDADQIKRDFGAKVRSVRKSKGLSQEDLALARGLDRTYIGGVERGERNISLVNIYRIAYALSVAPEVFL